MKFKLLTLIITKLLGIDEDAENADMHLPVWVAGFGLALFLVGFTLIAAFITTMTVGFIIAAVICFPLGIAALLCYKNQRVYILSDEEFQYSTFLGKKTIYKFSEINRLQANSDSMTLFVGEGKVHIESCAIRSDRFNSLINKALAEKYGYNDN